MSPRSIKRLSLLLVISTAGLLMTGCSRTMTLSNTVQTGSSIQTSTITDMLSGNLGSQIETAGSGNQVTTGKDLINTLDNTGTILATTEIISSGKVMTTPTQNHGLSQEMIELHKQKLSIQNLGNNNSLTTVGPILVGQSRGSLIYDYKYGYINTLTAHDIGIELSWIGGFVSGNNLVDVNGEVCKYCNPRNGIIKTSGDRIYVDYDDSDRESFILAKRYNLNNKPIQHFFETNILNKGRGLSIYKIDKTQNDYFESPYELYSVNYDPTDEDKIFNCEQQGISKKETEKTIKEIKELGGREDICFPDVGILYGGYDVIMHNPGSNQAYIIESMRQDPSTEKDIPGFPGISNRVSRIRLLP